MMRTAILATVLAACSTAAQTPDPEITITQPQRGTIAQGDTVTVTGTVTNASSVFVNGTSVTPDASGAFSVDLAVAPGITVIESHAQNGAADVRDVRAVLAGPTKPTDGSVKAPLGAHASPAALTTIGKSIATSAKALDYTALAQAMNPVYNNTGCLGAKIDITSIDLSNISVGLQPIANSLTTDVAISNVVVKLHADFKAACIGGSTTITVKSSTAHLHGGLAVGVSGGKLATSIGTVTVALDGFSMDVGGVPGAVEDLFNGIVRGKVEDALASMIHDKVPGMANNALAGLVAKPLSVAIAGKQATFGVTPKSATITTDGLTVAVDTTVKVETGDGALALAQMAPFNTDLISQSTGLGVALSADSVNQLFGGLWAAGAIDQTLPMSAVGPVAILLDPQATTLDVKLMLPPTVTTGDDGLELALGDLMVTTHDDAGNVIQQLALSVKTTLKAGPTQTGKLLLTVGDPDVHAQIIQQADSVNRPLTDDAVTGIVSSVWGLVGGMADDALAKLPMPAIAGVQLGAPLLSGSAGFLVADLAVE